MGAAEIQNGRRNGRNTKHQHSKSSIDVYCHSINFRVVIILTHCDQETLSVDMRRCYELLRQTSRSFAAVIQALDDDLRYII